MKSVVDFIREFKLSSYGFDMWDMWIAFGILIVVSVLARWIVASFLPASKTSPIKRTLSIVFNTIFYVVLTFVILNALLLDDHLKVTLIIFLMVVPHHDKFFQAYDNLVDKIVNRK